VAQNGVTHLLQVETDCKDEFKTLYVDTRARSAAVACACIRKAFERDALFVIDVLLCSLLVQGRFYYNAVEVLRRCKSLFR
jgi:hypothetical protein